MANTPHSDTPGRFSCGSCGFGWESTAGALVARYCPSCGAFETISFAPDHAEPEGALEISPLTFSDATPLLMEEIIGWRAWRVHELGKLLRLGSVTHSAERYGMAGLWPTRRWVVAECSGERFCQKADDGRIPGDNCSCGLYAAASYKQLTHELGYSDYDNREVRVIGQVAMAGDVIEGSQGWRAEKARVHHLFVPHTHWKLGKRLSEQYGVPYDTHRWLG